MSRPKYIRLVSIPIITILAIAVLIRYTNVTELFAKNKTATGTAAVAGRDDNMALGNPSHATADESNQDNYLMVKPMYSLSYNNTNGMANWVSWHLSTAWLGDADRCNCFTTDNSLPAGFGAVRSTNYIGSGFDRGHLCPSGDRSATAEENAATFLMTNMSPQAPILNEQTWEHLEAYCRRLVMQGNELYIIAGSHGTGGEGKKGSAETIAGGKINVPSYFWKIIVVLPVGDNDIQRITKTTRVIAVDMPNRQNVNEYDWPHYRTTVDAIEAETGYDFLSAVPAGIQEVIEASIDNGPLN
jgi:endonuclease G